MRAVNYRELRRRYELDGAHKTLRHFQENLNNGNLAADDFSIRDMAEALIGREFVDMCSPGKRGSDNVLESTAGLDTSMFANLAKRVVGTGVQARYGLEQFVFSGVIPTMQTKFTKGFTRQGTANIGEAGKEVKESESFDSIGFGEQSQTFPATKKYGRIVPITKEAVHEDDTGTVLDNAGTVGEWLGLTKEKQLIDVIIGATNNYVRNGTASDTYQTSSPWVNDIVKVLENYTDLDEVEQLFAAITDPDTSEPILVGGLTLVTGPKKRVTANNIVSATQIRVGDTTAATAVQTVADNPMSGYTPVSSRLLAARLTAASLDTASWVVGDLQQAFAWMENWGLTMEQENQNSRVAFEQDILFRFKASWRGAAIVKDPRFAVRCKAS